MIICRTFMIFDVKEANGPEKKTDNRDNIHEQYNYILNYQIYFELEHLSCKNIISISCSAYIKIISRSKPPCVKLKTFIYESNQVDSFISDYK